MKNIYFPEEEITKNDLFFVCSMIERVARQMKQRNRYVVNKIGYQGLLRQLSIADTLHCENPLKVADDWMLLCWRFRITFIALHHTMKMTVRAEWAWLSPFPFGGVDFGPRFSCNHLSDGYSPCHMPLPAKTPVLG